MADYSLLDKFLHSFALGSNMRAEMIHDMERGAYLKSAPADEGKHVFVTGLARAGTTILMREIHRSDAFGSLSYADMPFVLAPNLWHKFSANNRKAGDMVERAHGDGIKVDFYSPEALDEVYWRVFAGKEYIYRDRLVPHAPDAEQMAGYSDLIRLILLRTGKQRYLSKSNNSILRLPSLAKAFPDAVFLIPIRNPLDHAHSLLSQHKRFSQGDKFTHNYMKWLGHHEFGVTHKPFAWDGIVIKGDPLTLDYWLAQWVAAHKQIAAVDTAHANVQLISYQALKNDATIWPAVAQRIGITPTPMAEIQVMPDRGFDKPQNPLFDEADNLFRVLEDRAHHSLGAV
ncbi:MAG: sulfotransferase [Sphingobium sp.]